MKACRSLAMALIVVPLVVLSLSSCDTETREGAGFAISLTESGERILADEHIAAYVWDEHRILLSPRGVERWESFVEFDKSQDPPIRKMGGLTTKEFVVTLNGVQMYRGHFSSMVSSLANSGVLLYDTLGVPPGEVWMTFTRLDGALEDDPRALPDIAAYFRKQGKLRESH
jgi:hypothetical protein